MGAFSTLGSASKTTFIHSESHKTSHEFTVGATAVKMGMPVKLAADGSVIPWVKTDGEFTLVGVAMTTQGIGELVTVWTRGYMIIWAMAANDVVPAPVSYDGYDSTHADGAGSLGYVLVDDAAVTAANQFGWALDVALQFQMTRVLVKN